MADDFENCRLERLTLFQFPRLARFHRLINEVYFAMQFGAVIKDPLRYVELFGAIP